MLVLGYNITCNLFYKKYYFKQKKGVFDMTNTDQEIFMPHPQPRVIQNLSDIPPQPISPCYAQEVRLNKLKQLQVSLSYYKDEMTYPLKKINGNFSDAKKTLEDYFVENGITEFGPVFKVSMLDILKIDTALMKDGYYPNFIDCYNNNFEESFKEIRVIHDFCKYQSALVQKYETNEVAKVLSERLEELFLGDDASGLNSLTMKKKNGLVFWMSNFVPKVHENKFLSKLFEFDKTVSDYVNVDSKENCEDTFDYFEHIIEVSDCVVRLIFLSETNLVISLEKSGEVLSRYDLEVQDYEIHVTREKLGE